MISTRRVSDRQRDLHKALNVSSKAPVRGIIIWHAAFHARAALASVPRQLSSAVPAKRFDAVRTSSDQHAVAAFLLVRRAGMVRRPARAHRT